MSGALQPPPHIHTDWFPTEMSAQSFQAVAARQKELNDEKAKISTFKAVENKRKRFKLERDITERLQKEGVCLLENGRTLLSTSQLGVELQSRDHILCTMKEEAALAKLEA